MMIRLHNPATVAEITQLAEVLDMKPGNRVIRCKHGYTIKGCHECRRLADVGETIDRYASIPTVARIDTRQAIGINDAGTIVIYIPARYQDRIDALERFIDGEPNAA